MLVRTRLSVMMFLQYFVWGAWFVTLSTYLSTAKDATGARIFSDQFIGAASDRYIEVQTIFQGLRDPYERLYYTGLLHERHAKTQLLVGYAPHVLLPLVEEAMRCFAEAEKIRPPGNDDSILRWNRCVRLLESRPDFHFERGPAAMDTEDMPPISSPVRRAGGHH